MTSQLEFPASPFELHDFTLAAWQQHAVDKWWAGDVDGPHRGTLEIFTGGGKTLIALACAARAAAETPDMKLAVVVPTEALARQWRDVLRTHTHLSARDIGVLGAGRKDSFEGHRALITVLASAWKKLPELATTAQPLMLIVDECHRAGADKTSLVLDTEADYRLGLSATPDREEVDKDGEPIEYDQHKLGLKLGRVVYQFSLRDARLAGWLPEYEIMHHGVELLPAEQQEYDALSRRVDDAADKLQGYGVETNRARSLRSEQTDVGRAAQVYVTSTSLRKDLLYRAAERTRVATSIVTDELSKRDRPRILIFHERVDEAEELFRRLNEVTAMLSSEAVAPVPIVGLEHSKLPARQRERTLEAFRAGEVPVLVSVKSLIEGVDVPEADVGVSVASSSSVRQRIQSLGRVLRKGDPTTAEPKRAVMHILYVSDTVDEIIYAKEDWSDLTGVDVNHYWHWSAESSPPPEPRDGPPRTPRPTEEQEWDRLGRRPPSEPVKYEGVLPHQEYSVDTTGTVRNRTNAVIMNPQGVADMVERVRGRAGGRFFVTPAHRLVLVFEGKGGSLLVVGALGEPFAIRELGAGAATETVDTATLKPGDRYDGPTDAEGGEFRISQVKGGTVERRRGRDRQFAFTAGAKAPGLEQNALRAVEAWRSLGASGMKFSVNGAGHAWYLANGEPRFLADVPGGFEFPDPVVQGKGGQGNASNTEPVPGEHATPGAQGGEVPRQA